MADIIFGLAIGDCKLKSHCLRRLIAVKSNESLENIRKAYFESVHASKVKFTDEIAGWFVGENYPFVCGKSNDDEVSDDVKAKLLAFGINVHKAKYMVEGTFSDYVFEDIENFAYLLMDFIKLSLPTLKYSFIKKSEKAKEQLPSFNELFADGFFHNIGYGLDFMHDSADYHFIL